MRIQPPNHGTLYTPPLKENQKEEDEEADQYDLDITIDHNPTPQGPIQYPKTQTCGCGYTSTCSCARTCGGGCH